MKRKIMIVILVCLITISALGCSNVQEPEEKLELTILYSSHSDFKRDFGGQLATKFKNVSFKVVEYSSYLGTGMWNNLKYVPQSGGDWDTEALLSLIEKEQPDIIYFPASVSSTLLKSNLLLDSTEFLGSSPELSGIDSSYIEAMETMGDGRINVLPDSIASQAIYYNKAIFDGYGFQEPEDFMDWDRVLELSNMISERGAGEGVAGLLTPNHSIVDLFLQIGKAQRLTWYSPGQDKVYFAEDSWKSILESIIQKYRLDSSLPDASQQASEAFINGKAAMVLDTFHLRDKLMNHRDVQWGVITEPVGQPTSVFSSTLAFESLSGINKNTPNIDQAREVWAYLNGQQVARNKHNANVHRITLPVRSNLIKDNEARNLNAFYKLKPMVNSSMQPDSLSISAESAVKSYLADQIPLIAKEELTIDEAVAVWETEVPKILMNNQ
ncbi:hypothetical protein DNH61_08095 [Paenibacillus sambharensis]|uniref:ABC transporter substrate-binding protein n=1 Tax=Paenibacillus sambharensis TaxID=1803190 RepID=A0A2W1LB66_9BACL|nr:extracellular solute-binding protein [Paenibacillus sambharensis]PZD96456.1 hypothetical protein DNH61_08095 [Paenibacillus sambharensis]